MHAAGGPAIARPGGERATDARLALVETFFDGTGPTYDRMVFWATLGIDTLWKRLLVARIPTDARRVLDLACGTGISTFAIARARPDCTVTGVELRDEYLAVARAKLAREPRSGVTLVLSRAEDFANGEPFDCITSSYLAKYADLPVLIARNAAMLRPGGLLQMHDFSLPPLPALRAIWRAYFWLMQRTVARMVPSWRAIYVGLPKLIESTRWLDELPALLRAHGFEHVRVEYLTLGGSALVSASKPSTLAASSPGQ